MLVLVVCSVTPRQVQSNPEMSQQTLAEFFRLRGSQVWVWVWVGLGSNWHWHNSVELALALQEQLHAIA